MVIVHSCVTIYQSVSVKRDGKPTSEQEFNFRNDGISRAGH